MRSNIKFFIPVILLCSSFQLTAQHELWGVTMEGGGVKGVIFKTDSSGSNLSIEYNFKNYERYPKGNLMQASNGKYYGMSEGGGFYGKGTIFEYDYSTDSVKVLHDFDGTATGANPKGDLCQASNGKFYGMTHAGGTANQGSAFEFDLSDTTVTKIYDCDWGLNARRPYGSFVEASNGKLYGMTREGGTLGASGSGTILELDPSGPTLSIIYTFSNTQSDGLVPLGNLLPLCDSLLYGLTPEGGNVNQGTIFKFNINTNTHTKVGDFDAITGQNPKGSLMKAKNGNLYGMFRAGSGDSYVGGIFEYDMAGDTLLKRFDFGSGTATGGNPEYSSLVEGDSNQFLGMTNRGGANDDGVIFKFNNTTGTYTTVYDFDLPEPSGLGNDNVFGSLIESDPGKFLGMTNIGGNAMLGNIFELDTLTNTVTSRHSFDSYSPGQKPKGSLLAASNGEFYGLTVDGGAYNRGALFEYDPFTGTYIKLHDFDGTVTGANPNSSLIEASNGKYYGVTRWGGVDWQGTLFEFDPSTGVLTKLYDFGYSSSWKPGRPIGSLMQASNGKLYGLSSYGGPNSNNGTLYEFDISSNSLTIKNALGNGSGKSPEGGLVEATSGVLYGMARNGGTGWGTLFQYNISGDSITVEHNFENLVTGREPTGDLLLASNGKLYGMTSNGGANGGGTLFVFDIGNDTLIKLHDFNGSTTGKYPYGSLVESSNGKLYGMTGGGTDASFYGTLFEVDTIAHTVTKIHTFNQTDGSKPYYTQLIKILYGAEWTGAVSTDWHNPANWLQNDIPTVFTEVVIPDVSGASGNFPVISANARVRDITIDTGASINMQNGVELKVGKEE